MNDFLKTVLPWIGAAATGGVPALVGMAAKTVGDVLGVDVKPEAKSLSDAVAGATPAQIIELKKAEEDFQYKMQALGFNHLEEMAKLGLEETKVFVGDTSDARAKYAANEAVFWLGVFILLTFALIIGLSLWGCYLLLSGGITIKDVGIVAAVFGFLGTIVGYVAANAQQVVGFFYGSSKGSNDKSELMASAFSKLGEAQGAAK